MTNLYEVNKSQKSSIVDFIKDTFEDHRTRMINYYRVWALQLAWTRGHQNVNFNKDTRQWIKEPRESWQNKLVSNFMIPQVRQAVSRTLAINASWDCIPATPDEEDIQIANMSKKILGDTWQRQGMDFNLVSVLFWRSTIGNGFLKVGWDAEVGEELEFVSSSIEDQILQDFLEVQGLTEVPKKIKVKAGDLFIEPIPPFNVTVDHMVSNFNDSDYVIETQIRSLDWIVDKFGNKWKDKLKETNESDVFLYPYVYSEQQIKNKRGIATHELFVKKNNKFKDGWYALMADEEFLITPRPLPFEHGLLPYAHFLEIFDPTSMWGTCTAEQIRPVQARYNEIQSKITDHIKQMANIQWLVHKQAGVTSITNRPGGVIEWAGSHKPERDTCPPLPSYVENQLERSRRDMQDISSLHDVSTGKNEAGVRSSLSITALQDADDAVNASTLLLFKHSLERVGKLAIMTIAEFVSEEKTLTVVGDYNEQQMLTFTGTDLTGSKGKDYFDVRVLITPLQGMSRLSRQSLIETLLEFGIIDPIRDKDIILGAIGLADTFTTLDGYASDRARQWREIKSMVAGEKVTPTQGEQHTVHIRMIDKWISGGERDRVSPEVLKVIVEHRNAHIQVRALEIALEQLALQEAISEVANVGRTEEDPRGRQSTSGGQATRAGNGQASGTRAGTRAGTRTPSL